MKIHSGLYIGETIKAPGKILKKLKRQSLFLTVWVITLTENTDMLEIYHSKILNQKYMRYREFRVVGIAGSYEEALDLVVRITQECFDRRGNADLKAYLKEIG